MATPAEITQLAADRLAITDVMLRSFEFTDLKAWDQFEGALH